MTLKDDEHLASALARVRDSLAEASAAFDDSLYGTGRYDDDDTKAMAEHFLEKAFTQLFIVLDRLNLGRTYARLEAIYERAAGSLLASSVHDGDPYLDWPPVIHRFVDGLSAGANIVIPTEVTRDIGSIIRRSAYSITDLAAFGSQPKNEADVHNRIEAVLKCIFRDLITKPTLTKPLKNFIPDTGIPSLRTLIEYKFVTSKQAAKVVADQVLADTRGYISSDWDHFIYVIYETERVYDETKWTEHLRKSGVGNEVAVIVISGEPAPKEESPQRRSRGQAERK